MLVRLPLLCVIAATYFLPVPSVPVFSYDALLPDIIDDSDYMLRERRYLSPGDGSSGGGGGGGAWVTPEHRRLCLGLCGNCKLILGLQISGLCLGQCRAGPGLHSNWARSAPAYSACLVATDVMRTAIKLERMSE